MPVDRISGPRFARNPEQARNSARDNLEFALANRHALVLSRGGEKILKDAEGLLAQVKTGQLTPNQYSYVDGIYEATMKALGLPSVERHHDKPKANLRHPR